MTSRARAWIRRVTALVVGGLLCVLSGPSEADPAGDPPSPALEASPSAPTSRAKGAGEKRTEAPTPRARERERLGVLRRSEAAFFEGLSAQQQGDLEAAQAAYGRAIRADSGFVEARVNLARIFIERGDFDSAHKQLTRVVAVRTEYPAAYAVRALLALQQGEWMRARGDLERALALDPALVEARINLAALLIQQSEFSGARIELERAAEQAPHSPEVLFNRGLLEDLESRRGEASYYYAQYLERALPGDPLRDEVRARLDALGFGATPPVAQQP